jgi:hypothetical protein
MAERLLITFAQVAERLGVPLERLYRVHRTLREEHGFPRHVPGLSRLWDPQAIDAWLARQRGESISVGGTAEREAGQQLDDWAAVLDQRAAAMGGA